MQLELTSDEAAVLREMIEAHLGDLSMEISHTDSPTFRQALRLRRDVLRLIAARIATTARDDRAVS
jgi:hypothetical protein